MTDAVSRHRLVREYATSPAILLLRDRLWACPFMMQERKTLLIEVLHLFALFSLAVGQPLYDLLKRYPEFLIAHQITPIGLISLVVVVSLLVPGVAVLLWRLIGRIRPEWRKVLYLLAIFALVTLILMPPLKMLPEWLSGLRAGGAILAGVAFAWSYSRFANARSFVTFLSPAIILSPALFLYQNPLLQNGVRIQNASVSGEMDATAPIVFVVLDEFPVTSLMNEEKELDAARYPNFDRLARQATWYRSATSIADNTTRALPALLTGNYPKEDALPLIADYPNNLFTLLGGSYRLNISEGASLLAPDTGQAEASALGRSGLLFADLGLIYLHIISPPKLIRTVLPPIRQTWMGFGDPAVWMHRRWLWELEKDRLQTWAEFVEGISFQEESDLPSLNFLHILLPHSPFQYLPSGRKYALDPGARALATGRWESEEEAIHSYYRHLLQVGFVDRLLGDLIDRLERIRLFDRALIVVTADHGISFRAGDSPRAVTATNVWDVISIPLFIKMPFQQRGRIDDSEVQIIDIVPTVARELNVPLPWITDGRDLRDAFDRPPERRVYSSSDSSGLRSFQHESEGWFAFPLDSKAKYASLHRKIALFGSGARSDGFFHPVYAEPVVGRNLESFQVSPAPNFTVQLDRKGTLGRTLSRKNFLQTGLSGRLRFGKDAVFSRRLLIAVDDVVRAVALVDPKGEFSAVLPEAAFSEGRNEIRLFLEAESSDAGRLRLLELKSR